MNQSGDRKAALITGAAKRIGKHIAITLASLGYDIIIHYNSSHEEAKSLKSLIKNRYNVEAEIFVQDFINDEDYEKLIRFSLKKFPHLNILVNNASVFLEDNLFNSTAELFDKHYKIHVKAPFFLIQNLINLSNNLSNNTSNCEKELKIINVIDTFIEKKTAKNYFSYLLSKKSLYILTEMIREYVELNNLNIKVYSLLPDKVL